MNESDVLFKISKFEKAVNRLDEAVQSANDDLQIDGVIQRFEFTVELLWKSLKALLAYEGIECYSPKNCAKEAFRAGIIEDDETILDMIEDRNASSHIYDEKSSREIFSRIKNRYLAYLKKLNFKKRL